MILLHYEHQDETLDYIKAFLVLQSFLGRISFTSVKVKRSSKPDSSMIQNLFKPVERLNCYFSRHWGPREFPGLQ